MSVQVRRRREAAAFLATYVGAQGELLVDTTNNRVQVHDGATPGGWPAARIADLSGRNAVVNGNFAINQRAYVANASLSAGTYAHDRWKAGSGGCTYAFTQSVPDTTITITAGTLTQVIEAPYVAATSYWLSWSGTAQARVWQGSAAGTYAASPVFVSGITPGATTNLEFATGTLGVVQFEAALPNAGPTRYERRLGELQICQRYFQRFGGAAYRRFGLGNAGSTTLASAFGLFPTTMRVTPTFSYGGNLALALGFNTPIAATSISLDATDMQSFNLIVAVSGGLTAGTTYQFIASNDATAHLDFSAEL